MTLMLFGNANMPPKTESLSFAVLEAMETFKETLEASQIAANLDDNTKHVAFQLLHDKNLTTVKKTVAIYELIKSNHLFVRPIYRLIDKRDFKTAGQLACELHLFKEFDLRNLLVPLFLEDRMVIFENYVSHMSEKGKIEVVQFLDDLLRPPLSVLEKCERMVKKFFIANPKPAKFEEKTVNTLIERLATTHKLVKKTVAPLHYHFKLSKKLGFAVRYHYEDERSSDEAFQDQLQELRIEENVDLQVELLERLMALCKYHDAKRFAQDYRVPSERIPTALNDYIETGIVYKRPKDVATDNDPMLLEPEPGADEESSAAAVPDQQVPMQDNGWSDDEHAEAEPVQFYELNLDPAQIIMVDTVKIYNDMFLELKPVTEIAFDTEHTTVNTVSILQIATREKVYVVDILGLQKLKLDDVFWAMMGRRLFNNKDVVKFGFDINKDVEMLQKITKMGIESPCDGDESYRDLKTLGMDVFKIVGFKYPHHEEGIKTLGLAKLTKLCFGKKLDKRNQLSNWSLRPFRPEQLAYAAIDAFVLFKLHDVIVECLKKLGIAEEELKNNLFE